MQRQRLHVLILVCVLGFSLCLNLWHNDFGRLHPDESKKADFIRGKPHDFQHPALMIQTARLINRLCGFENRAAIIRLGRTASALWGTLAVLFAYLIAKRIMAPAFTLLAAFAVATAPIMVVHAHYLKEDLVFSSCALLSLWRFIAYARQPSRLNAVWLGMATGLALSAHYKSALLVGLYLLLPRFLSSVDRKRIYHNGVIVAALSAGVFLLVNWQLLGHSAVFFQGLGFSMKHALSGHVLHIMPHRHWFLWHFRHSLVPGLSGLMAFGGGISLLAAVVVWKRLGDATRISAAFAIMYYMVVECSPLKAFPDYMRYVVPAAPAVILFAALGADFLYGRSRNRWSRRLLAAVLILALVWPLSDTLRLVYYINKDTRQDARQWLLHTRHRAVWDKYALPGTTGQKLPQRPIAAWRAAGYTHLVTSSFQYGRYLYGSGLKRQDPQVYAWGNYYRELFGYPFTEISPAFKTFAFSNPTIRIVTIMRPPGRAFSEAAGFKNRGPDAAADYFSNSSR